MKNHTGAWKKMMSSTPAHSRSKNNKNHPYHLSRHGGISDIRIRELRRATPEALKDINNLLPQLSKTAKPLTLVKLKDIIKSKDSYLIVVRDRQKVIGMSTLVVIRIAAGIRAKVEDVVVDEKYRGRGIGERIIKELIFLAKRKRVESIELTSRSSRVAANKLYQKLGFEKRDTNVYRISF